MELEDFGDLLGEYSTSEGIVDDGIFSEAAQSGKKAMTGVRNFIIGIVGIAICLLLIGFVIKKMNKSRK